MLLRFTGPPMPITARMRCTVLKYNRKSSLTSFYGSSCVNTYGSVSYCTRYSIVDMVQGLTGKGYLLSGCKDKGLTHVRVEPSSCNILEHPASDWSWSGRRWLRPGVPRSAGCPGGGGWLRRICSAPVAFAGSTGSRTARTFRGSATNRRAATSSRGATCA
eukprot:1195141-Prorocentrum_minimum.AAC.2